ncbi:MAG TPA: hypothetical protein ENN45_00530 [Bacteroidetes bacterium]|nr:hypothetical protein [Bacteroidota bacterium]
MKALKYVFLVCLMLSMTFLCNDAQGSQQDLLKMLVTNGTNLVLGVQIEGCACLLDMLIYEAENCLGSQGFSQLNSATKNIWQTSDGNLKIWLFVNDDRLINQIYLDCALKEGEQVPAENKAKLEEYVNLRFENFFYDKFYFRIIITKQ